MVSTKKISHMVLKLGKASRNVPVGVQIVDQPAGHLGELESDVFRLNIFKHRHFVKG